MNRGPEDAVAKSTRRKSPFKSVVTEPLGLFVGVHVAADPGNQFFQVSDVTLTAPQK
jgi:hypothetical protein